MFLPNSAVLKERASSRLGSARQPQKVMLVYAAVTAAVSALVMVLQNFLGEQISQAGGLHNLGSRSFFATLQALLPVLQSGILLCLDLGLVNAMLRISRRQYASPNSLRMGFDRFWPLVRVTLLQALIFMGLGIGSFYVALILFMISPFADRTIALLTPLVNEPGFLSGGIEGLDAASAQAMVTSMLPFFIMYLIVLVLLGAPVYYRYRMTSYVLIDNPGMGAFRVLRQSKEMMRGNILSLLRLDLSFWWYYLLLVLSGVLCYGDVILSALGRTLPLPEQAAYSLFYFLYLGAMFAVNYCVRSTVEVTYAAAYDSLRPEPPSDGVVLGNIFQM